MHTVMSCLRKLAIPLLAVVGSTLTVNPILSAEPADELKAIRELLKKIDERMENQNTISMQMLDRQQRDFNQLKDDLIKLRDEIAQARREMADVRGRTNGTPTTSYFGGSAPTAPMTASAAIKLVNTYPSEMTAYINGSYFTVAPGQTRTVPLYPGNVMYQVFQTQPVPKTTVLSAGEVLTLRLYPQ
jgi:hypothetical protein